jgi:glycosyltransferase involved in cell wall biosynthesis
LAKPHNSISTVIPTFNRSKMIARSITSALDQLLEHDELIVIDDGSTDDTEKVVSAFKDRVRYIKTPNQGVGAARNRGVQEAQNPLITFLDSDDEWMPGRISVQRAFMDAQKDILFCFSDCAFRSKKGTEERFTLHTWHDDKRTWDEILGPGLWISSIVNLPEGLNDFTFYVGDIYLSALVYGNYLNVNTLMVRKYESGASLRFAEDTDIYEEWECLGRLSQIGKCAFFDCETVWQNAHSFPRITDADGLVRIRAQIQIMKRVWGNDIDFLKKHGNQYNRILLDKQLSRVGGLILRGQTKEAREKISQMTGCPASHRLLARLPGWVAMPTANIMRNLKSILLK